MMRKKLPELLLPAGGTESVHAAVENGCTAVYAGASAFSARKNAENFTAYQLEDAVKYCRMRGVKFYVAANTLIKNSELDSFLELVEGVYKVGADGVIVQDIGCAARIKRRFPDFYMLASTQMTAHSLNDVKFLSERGFDRIILSRELSINEITHICENSRADIECFVHGALCVSYSGQCLFSSFNGSKVGARSGNRGACAQPCRLKYDLHLENTKIENKLLLSPKDMLGLHALPRLIESGVKSLKIEGRMKSAEYVAAAAKIYRKYLDLYAESPDKYSVDEKDALTLAAVFNRSGFNNGYFDTYAGKSMMTVRKSGNTGVLIGKADKIDYSSLYFRTKVALVPGDGIEIAGGGAYITKSYAEGEVVRVRLDEGSRAEDGDSVYRTYDKKLMDELRRSVSADTRKLEVNGVFLAKAGEQTRFEVTCEAYDVSAITLGELPESALKSAVSRDMVEKQLRKTGGTTFKLEKLEISLDDGLFINITQLNELRRNALAKLEAKIAARIARNYVNRDTSTNVANNNEEIRSPEKKLTVLVRSKEQLQEVSKYSVSRIYIDFDLNDKQILERLKANGNAVYRCLGRIERDGESLTDVDIDGYDGVLVRTYGQADIFKRHNVRLAADYTLNVFNSESVSFWLNEKCESVCVSPELELSEIGGNPHGVEALCYGKPVVMTTVQCPIGNFAAAKAERTFCKYKGNPPVSYIVQANGEGEENSEKLDLMPVCNANGAGCHCLLLASKPIALGEKAFLANGGFEYGRIEFTNEESVDVNNIMSTYVGAVRK